MGIPFDIKPGVMNWLLFGVMAVTFIVFMKWVMVKFPIPGLKEVIAAV